PADSRASRTNRDGLPREDAGHASRVGGGTLAPAWRGPAGHAVDARACGELVARASSRTRRNDERQRLHAGTESSTHAVASRADCVAALDWSPMNASPLAHWD